MLFEVEHILLQVTKEEHAERAEALKPETEEAPKEGVNLGLSGEEFIEIPLRVRSYYLGLKRSEQSNNLHLDNQPV